MSWSSDYWFDRAEAEALSLEGPVAAPLAVCQEIACAHCAVQSWKLYMVDGTILCARHAAKRENLTESAWNKRRQTQAKRDKLNPAGKAARERDGVS
jgi:hypothetical protein